MNQITESLILGSKIISTDPVWQGKLPNASLANQRCDVPAFQPHCWETGVSQTGSFPRKGFTTTRMPLLVECGNPGVSFGIGIPMWPARNFWDLTISASSGCGRKLGDAIRESVLERPWLRTFRMCTCRHISSNCHLLILSPYRCFVAMRVPQYRSVADISLNKHQA